MAMIELEVDELPLKYIKFKPCRSFCYITEKKIKGVLARAYKRLVLWKR